ncbi:hypothetical protein [Streptomyces albus]|uniref:hypothetical protein n=1 Tax=Streptomyces albus TaxID=1888 RepID=UPI000AF61C5F|nr:hypothetical protein [Streptomyces albus]
MPARKFPVIALVAMAAGLALTACDNGTGSDNAAPSRSASASAPHSPSSSEKSEKPEKPESGTVQKSAPGAAKKSGERCTDQLNYAGDSRSNAEINSIGEESGTCPVPEKAGSGCPVPEKAGSGHRPGELRRGPAAERRDQLDR